MRRGRQQNLSTGAKVALAVTGVVLVPVVLAGVGIYAMTRVAKQAREDLDAEIDEAETGGMP